MKPAASLFVPVEWQGYLQDFLAQCQLLTECRSECVPYDTKSHSRKVKYHFVIFISNGQIRNCTDG